VPRANNLGTRVALMLVHVFNESWKTVFDDNLKTGPFYPLPLIDIKAGATYPKAAKCISELMANI